MRAQLLNRKYSAASLVWLGAKPPVISDNDYLAMGGPDEATYYVTECGPAWHCTPGAVAWLTKLAAPLPPKQRTRATMLICLACGVKQIVQRPRLRRTQPAQHGCPASVHQPYWHRSLQLFPSAFEIGLGTCDELS
jgi:hypothetical protein